MTELERQLTTALEKLSAQYETEQQRHSEQVEALQQRVEQQAAQSETLRLRRPQFLIPVRPPSTVGVAGIW